MVLPRVPEVVDRILDAFLVTSATGRVPLATAYTVSIETFSCPRDGSRRDPFVRGGELQHPRLGAWTGSDGDA
jgi:hypothetical protein